MESVETEREIPRNSAKRDWESIGRLGSEPFDTFPFLIVHFSRISRVLKIIFIFLIFALFFWRESVTRESKGNFVFIIRARFVIRPNWNWNSSYSTRFTLVRTLNYREWWKMIALLSSLRECDATSIHLGLSLITLDWEHCWIVDFGFDYVVEVSPIVGNIARHSESRSDSYT